MKPALPIPALLTAVALGIGSSVFSPAVAQTASVPAAPLPAASARSFESVPPAADAVPRPLRPLSNDIAERVQACTLCHGAQGRATPHGYFPRLAGKPAGYLFNQLQNFRDGRRHHALMAGLLRNMNDDYLREIAGYFAALDVPYPPPLPSGLSAGQQARAERLVTQGDPARRVPACTACHGASMAGREPAVPGLLGLPRDYLVGQLGAWRGGARRAHAPDCMADVARALSGDDIAVVASWLAARPPGAHAEPLSSAPLPVACGGLSP